MKPGVVFILAYILLVFLLPGNIHAQDVSPAKAERELAALWTEIAKTKDDSLKLQICEVINLSMAEILESAGSFNYAFDSLKYLGKIYSTDSLLRIYTWNIPLGNGSNRYFGYVQELNQEDSTDVSLFPLNENIGSVLNTDSIYDQDSWYGALYYSAIAGQCDGKTMYTLLGLDLNDYYTSRKIIDILEISGGKLSFGSPVFADKEELNCRQVFEFSAAVSMMLRYLKEKNTIIFDHLSPAKPEFKGKFEYYGPDFSYDGYLFKNCRWNKIEDLDIKATQVY